MKRITLIAFLSFIAMQGFAQKKTIFGLYGGGGLGTTYNYNVAISGGLDFIKVYSTHAGIGANLFYQTYGLYYDNEAYGAKGGGGNAGVQLLNQSSYVFLCPKFDYGIGRNQGVHFYVNAGVGFNMGGTEELRKWDKGFGAGLGNYDSTIVTTTNITKMLLRVGTGFTEYFRTGKHWCFTVTEDFGFIGQNLSSSSDYLNPSRTEYSPRSLRPAYISLQIGISHLGFHED
ncbi:MAG: hypothetical protein JWQ38_3246 [Flavipsychrobacter sp.]|nr:hypothetical protein [Flavipsychrobacter sp.]